MESKFEVLPRPVVIFILHNFTNVCKINLIDCTLDSIKSFFLVAHNVINVGFATKLRNFKLILKFLFALQIFISDLVGKGGGTHTHILAQNPVFNIEYGSCNVS